MFLDILRNRNPQLMEVALDLHRTGDILPDTYVIDLDTLIENAKNLAKLASQEGIELFYMLKQIGRNPLVAQKIVTEAGIQKAVVVDYKEALVLMSHGLKIGNVGHLVQIPTKLIEKIMRYGTDYMTVYSLEKLKEIIEIAEKLGVNQGILLKIIEPGDCIYDGQYGGFHISQLDVVMDLVKSSEYVHIAGITSFPCFLFDDNQELSVTENYKTLMRAKEALEKKGVSDLLLNMPSATCVKTIPMIKSLGGAQGEPGHALTGTTPLHAVSDQAEIPAMVYVSEVSHNLDGRAYFFGGGYYRRGHFQQVAIYQPGSRTPKIDRVYPLKDESIDYYITTHHSHEVGSTVLGAFRTQMFVTRSDVAIVSGIRKGAPVLEGLYDGLGNKIRR